MTSGVSLRGLSPMKFYEGVRSLTFRFRGKIKVVQPWKDIWLWGKHDKTHKTLVKCQEGRGAQFMLHLNLRPFFFFPPILEFKFLFETFALLRLKTSLPDSSRHINTFPQTLSGSWCVMLGAQRWISLISVSCLFRAEFCICNHKNNPEELLIRHLNENMQINNR